MKKEVIVPFLFLMFFLMFLARFSFAAGIDIHSFPITGPDGTQVDSETVFSDRVLVLAVISTSRRDPCPGVGPFLKWRDALSQENVTTSVDVKQVVVICIGNSQMPPLPDNKESPFWHASMEAIRALQLSGTPVLLGIEQNKIQWRLAGLISSWQILSRDWISKQ